MAFTRTYQELGLKAPEWQDVGRVCDHAIIGVQAGEVEIDNAISGISSVFDYLKVSFATAIAPGYIAVIMNPSNSTGGYRLTSGYYQAAAMVETLLGTFLWAGFIATFAKKYMR